MQQLKNLKRLLVENKDRMKQALYHDLRKVGRGRGRERGKGRGRERERERGEGGRGEREGEGEGRDGE